LAEPTGGRALSGLGARLRALREEAGISGLQLAKALGTGWRQPKVSRIENGLQLPTEEEIRAWAEAVGAEPGPLLALRRKASAEYGVWKDRIEGAGSPAAFQDELRALEASCTQLLAEYQPALVPGLLQTAAFMREMADGEEFLTENGITPETIGPLIAAKLRRQAILYEGGCQVVHVLGEAVLRTRVGRVTVETMQGQLEHLAETATLPGHELGIVPFTVASPVAPASGFVLYDNDLAVVETLAGRLQISDPDIVARYARWLELLRQAAVTGAEAAEMCRRAAADYRGPRNPRGSLRALPRLGRGRPAHDVISDHRPPARREVVFVRVVQRPPAIALVHWPGPGSLVLPEPGPPAFPVPLVPRFALALQVGRSGRLGDVGQDRRPAPPAAAAALGQPMLSEYPQRHRHCRHSEPGGPGDLGAASSLRTERLVHERGRAAEHQERRVYRVNPAAPTPSPPDARRILARDPQRIAVGPGHPPR
jgi:transcriptional regulator with XRE-family HTH domain